MDQLTGLPMDQHELLMRQMVKEVLQGKLTIAAAADQFQVNRKTVRHWLDRVDQEAHSAPQTSSGQAPPSPPRRRASTNPPQADAQQLLELKTQVFSLQQELKAAKLKALYYATLVQVAEQELGIDIEKKSVTKQSGSCS